MSKIYEKNNCILPRERDTKKVYKEDMERVCVTGAGGYIASWVVKYLLSTDYMVHGTVRDPCDEKNSHLKKLENAAANLQLFKADLLDYESLCAAIAGCSGVFHVASPLPLEKPSNPEVELIEPAVAGTLNVLNACSETKVKKVVVVSTIGAIMVTPNWPKDRVMDESCWSDKEFCRISENWYCLSKTMAEREALEYSKRSDLNIVSVCPSTVIGPMLQSTVNSSSALLLSFFTGGSQPNVGSIFPVVDVRDVAEALLMVYEKSEAEGRYICSSHTIRKRVLFEKVIHMYPNYIYPEKFAEDESFSVYGTPISSEKLQKLGWKYRTLEESIVDSVENYEENGFLIFKKD